MLPLLHPFSKDKRLISFYKAGVLILPAMLPEKMISSRNTNSNKDIFMRPSNNYGSGRMVSGPDSANNIQTIFPIVSWVPSHRPEFIL